MAKLLKSFVRKLRSLRRERRVPFDKILPLELLTAICDHLTFNWDVEVFRLISKRCHEAAWPSFGRSFNNVLFHLTAPSLSALEKLTHCERAVPYIKHLQLSSIRLNPKDIPALGQWIQRDRPVRRHAIAEYRMIVQEDKSWNEDGEFVRVLCRVLVALWALEMIRVVDGRRRDGTPWTPGRGVLGGAEVEVPCCYYRDAYAATLDDLSDAVATSTTASSRIRELEIEGTVPLDALPHKMQDTAAITGPRLILPQLTHFELNLETMTSDRPSNISNLTHFLPSFLRGMQSLTHLRLNFPHIDYFADEICAAYCAAVQFLYGLSPTSPNPPLYLPDYGIDPTSLSPSLFLPKLTRLHLSNLPLRLPSAPQDFLALCAPALRHLTLQNFELKPKTWEELFKFFQGRMRLTEFELVLFGSRREMEAVRRDPEIEWVDLEEEVLEGVDEGVRGVGWGKG